MLLEGLFLPLTTPFYPDGRLYLRKLQHNIASYSKTPAAGLGVLTGIGEASLLSEGEAREVLRTAAEMAAPEKVLLAGVSRDSTASTLALAQDAMNLKYDAILVRAPAFLSPATDSQRVQQVLTYFQVVADQSPLPVVLVSGRSPENGALPMNLIAEMSRHSQVLGLVEADPTPARMEELRSATAASSREVTVTSIFAAVTRRMLAQRDAVGSSNYIAADTLTGGSTALAVAPPQPALKTRTKRIGFQLLAGRTLGMLEGLDGGAGGAMLPFAACAPQACYEVYAAWKDGDQTLAAEKQARLQSAALIEEDLGVPAIKVGCDLNGYYGGPPRLPRLRASGVERVEIEAHMRSLRS